MFAKAIQNGEVVAYIADGVVFMPKGGIIAQPSHKRAMAFVVQLLPDAIVEKSDGSEYRALFRSPDGVSLRDLGAARAKRAYHPGPGPLNVVGGVGLEIASALQERQDILKAAAYALEDLNYHDTAAELRSMLEPESGVKW